MIKLKPNALLSRYSPGPQAVQVVAESTAHAVQGAVQVPVQSLKERLKLIKD